jgi:hypothetical protein
MSFLSLIKNHPFIALAVIIGIIFSPILLPLTGAGITIIGFVVAVVFVLFVTIKTLYQSIRIR